MNKLIFVTGNQRKIDNVKPIFDKYGIDFMAVAVDIHEIQHHDPMEITKAKVIAAYDIIKKPVLVNDTSWSIPALNGFPGGYMKDVNHWFTAEDWLNIMKNKTDRTIIAQEKTAFYDGQSLKLFEEDVSGFFLDQPRGKCDTKLELVVSLYDGISIAEHYEMEKKHGRQLFHREHWVEFAKWYLSQTEPQGKHV
ncbi:MAG: hypothetical protein LBQ02_03365 [Candidatus Nomurabacteria bacterium]|nr:hypothetical protein [Candidatus Nomurabacteria bacterium]